MEELGSYITKGRLRQLKSIKKRLPRLDSYMTMRRDRQSHHSYAFASPLRLRSKALGSNPTDPVRHQSTPRPLHLQPGDQCLFFAGSWLGNTS